MKLFLFTLMMLCFSPPVLSAEATPQPSMGPVIKDFGPYLPVANPGFPVPTGQLLKVAFNVSKASQAGKLNDRLESPARFLNMHAATGLAPDLMHLAIVVHGPATRDLLTDDAYEKRFGSRNPNHALLDALSEAGVELILCGQSMAFGGYQRSEFLPQVKVALSAMTAFVSLQDQGYKVNPF